MIELRNATKAFNDADRLVKALENVNLKINKGDFLCISGPSGSGKTTLLSLIGNLMLPSDGAVFFEGKDMSALAEKERSRWRGENIGFIFQESAMIEGVQVWKNVLLQNVLLGAPAASMETAQKCLRSVGIENRALTSTKVLSFGERKRVAVARVLASDRPIIIADEPTGGLDRSNGEKVMEILERLNKENQKTVIFVTHDDYFAARADIRIDILDGKLQAPKRA